MRRATDDGATTKKLEKARGPQRWQNGEMESLEKGAFLATKVPSSREKDGENGNRQMEVWEGLDFLGTVPHLSPRWQPERVFSRMIYTQRAFT
jgi:hypothetical protein